MAAKITITWCEKHKNWWVTNCPDCMIDANEESIKREGRKEVIEGIAKQMMGNTPLPFWLASFLTSSRKER